MISDGLGPSQIEIKSLGIGLSYTSNIEKLDLNDDEYLVVGEQYTPINGTNQDTIYNLIINKDVVGIHTSRKRIDASSSQDDTVKTSGLYVGSDIICDGKIIAKSLTINDFTISDNIDNDYVSNFTIQIQNAIETISENNYISQGYNVLFDNAFDNTIDINNIYATSFLTLGNIGDTYGNTNKLNIAETANYNINNAQISIKNKINTVAQDEPANFRIGIVGDSAESPAVFSTTEGMPLTFHVSMKSEDVNALYSAYNGLPNYGDTLPSLTINTKGNICMGAIETEIQEFANFSNYTKLNVVGGGQIDDIFTFDRFSEQIKHIDDIYIRKIGKTFEANQIIPGDFDSSGSFRFNSDLYIGSNNNSYTLEVNNKLNVVGDLNVSNHTYLNHVEVLNDALFQKSIHVSENSFTDNDVIVGGDVVINNGGLKINDIRINISSLNPIMVDSAIAESSNINGSNILIFATSDVISYTSGSNMVIPGKLGVGIDKNSTYNEQFNIAKNNKDIYEISIYDYSEDQGVEFPNVLIGHHNFESDNDNSFVINTNNISDKLHNIYFYTGIDRNDISTTVPQLTIHQNGNIGINNKDPIKELHITGDILCNDIYITRNQQQTKAKFFISKKADFVKLGDETQDFFYLNDEEGINKYTINITEKQNNIFKGLNVAGGIHSTDDGYYENNLKLATMKIIDDDKKYAYVNNNISIGIQNPSNPDLNTFQTPLNIRNVSRENYNDSIIRIYRGNRQGGTLNSAKYSGIDICEYDLYRVDILNDINKNKWFIYKSHSQQKDTLDSSAMVGPLQFGYTDGTEHPEHYGMTMYYDKRKEQSGNNSSYHLDINARGVYDYTNKNFPKSAMSIYGDLDVHGNVNIINQNDSSFNYLIDGSGINISDSAVQNTVANNNEYNDSPSSKKHDVVVKGKKVAVLTDQTMFIGHRHTANNGVGNTGFQQYIKYYDEKIPLYVYQNFSETDVVGKFVSSSINTQSASIEIATNDYGRVDKTIVSTKLEISSNIETKNSVFKIKQYNQQGNGIDNFSDTLSIYNYSDVHNHILLGTQKFTDSIESEKIALHVDNPVEYSLQLTSENSPSINLHHRDSILNDFWTIKSSYGINYDKFAIQNSFSTDSYLPDTNNIKDVIVLTRDKLGLNVSDPEYAFDIKGVYDETSTNIVNRYSDVKLNQKYSAVQISNIYLEYETIDTDGIYDIVDNSYLSGIKYFINESNIPNIDINDRYVQKDAVLNSNIIASKSISGNKLFEFNLQIDEQFSSSNFTYSFNDHNIISNDDSIYYSNVFSYLPDIQISDDFDLSLQISNVIKQNNIEVNNCNIQLIYNFETLHSLASIFDIETESSVDDNNVNIIVHLKMGDETDVNNLIVNENEINIDGTDFTIVTSNIFHHNDIYREINDVEILSKINYDTNVFGPISIIKDVIDITYNYQIEKVSDSSNEVLITNVVDFLKDVPDGAYAGTETIFDIREIELYKIENHKQAFQIFDKLIEVNINISDKYKVYEFENEISDLLIDINTIDYAPHIILQNNVNFAGQENKYGRINEIFSKDGSLLFTSVTDDGLLKKSILNIDKDGDINTIGKLNVEKDIHTNGNIYTNTLETTDIIMNGNIYDKLGNILASFSNYEEMYNQALTLGADTWNLITSNYSVSSMSNIDFVLGNSLHNGFTFTKDNENLGDFQEYDIFTIKEGSEDVFKIIDGGFVGFKVEPDSNYDVSVLSKFYSPNIYNVNFEGDEIHTNTINAGYFIGDASLVSNVNLLDKNTDHLTEGTSNRYIINDTYITGQGIFDVVGDLIVSDGFVGDASRVSNVNLLDKDTDHLTEGTSNRYIINNQFIVDENETLNILGDTNIFGKRTTIGDDSTNSLSLNSSNIYIESSNISIKGEMTFVGSISNTLGVSTSSVKIETNETLINSLDITRKENVPDADFINVHHGDEKMLIVSSNFNIGIGRAPSDNGEKLQIKGDMSIDNIYSRSNVEVDEKVISKNMATSNVIISGNYSLLDSILLENSLDVSRIDLNADFVNVHHENISIFNINKNYNIGVGIIPIDSGEKLQVNGDISADNINIKMNLKTHQTITSNILIGDINSIDDSLNIKKSLDITRSINDDDFLHVHYNEENIFNVNKNFNVGIGKIPNEDDGKLQIDGTVFASNLNIVGLITSDSIKTSNLTILGETTEIMTQSYVTENLEINTYDIENPALKILKTFSDLNSFNENKRDNIFSITSEIQNIGDGEEPEKRLISIKADGDIDFINGISFNNGSAIFENGTVTSKEFIGIGSNLDHVFEYYYTSNLKEIGEYLYYTPTRSTNISNYVGRIDSELNTLIELNDTNISNYVLHTSNYLYQYTYDTASNIFQFYDNILEQMWNINNDRLSFGNIDVYKNKIVVNNGFTDTSDIISWYKLENDFLDYGKNGYDLTQIGTVLFENNSAVFDGSESHLDHVFSEDISLVNFNISFILTNTSTIESGDQNIIDINDTKLSIKILKVLQTSIQIIISHDENLGSSTQITIPSEETICFSINFKVTGVSLNYDIYYKNINEPSYTKYTKFTSIFGFSNLLEKISIGNNLKNFSIKDIRIYNRTLEVQEINSFTSNTDVYLRQVVLQDEFIFTSNQLMQKIDTNDINVSNYIDDLSNIVDSNSEYISNIDERLINFKYNELNNLPYFQSNLLLVGGDISDNNGFGAISASNIIYDNNNLGIGKYPESIYRLDIDGDVNLSGNVRLNGYIFKFTHLDGSIFDIQDTSTIDDDRNSMLYIDNDKKISKLTNIKWMSDSILEIDGNINITGNINFNTIDVDLNSMLYIDNDKNISQLTYIKWVPTDNILEIDGNINVTGNINFNTIDVDLNSLLYINEDKNISQLTNIKWESTNNILEIDGNINITGNINFNTIDVDLNSLLYINNDKNISQLTNIKWVSNGSILEIDGIVKSTEYKIGDNKFQYNHLDNKPTFTTNQLLVGGTATDNSNFGAGSAGNLYYNNNKLGIGKSNPSKALDVIGDVHVDGEITATGDITAGFSDIRLKNIVSNIENPVDKILNINCFKYTANETANYFNIHSKKTQIGVSAQDVQKVFPELVSLAPFDRVLSNSGDIVSKSGSNYLTVSYEKLVPVLIECVKELAMELKQIKENVNIM